MNCQSCNYDSELKIIFNDRNGLPHIRAEKLNQPQVSSELSNFFTLRATFTKSKNKELISHNYFVRELLLAAFNFKLKALEEAKNLVFSSHESKNTEFT